MSDKCEHLQVREDPNLSAGAFKPKNIKKLPKGEHFVNMVIHNGRLYVASTNSVYILDFCTNIESKKQFEYLRKLPLVTGE